MRMRAQLRYYNNEPILIMDNNLLSISFGMLDCQSVDDLMDFGICSNSGEISFVDKDNAFKNEYLDAKILSKNLWKVEIFVSSENFDKLLATFQIDGFDYDDETKKVKIILTDGLTDYQNVERNIIPYAGYDYNKIYKPVPASYIYSAALYGSNVDMTFSNPNVNDVMKNTIIHCPAINDNAWSALTNLCQLTLCRASIKANGNISFSHINDFWGKRNIKINPSNILGISNKVPTIKNRINNISLDALNRETYFDVSVIEPIEIDLYNLIPYYTQEGSSNVRWLDWEFIADNTTYFVKREDTGNYDSVANGDYFQYVTLEIPIRPKTNAFFYEYKPRITAIQYYNNRSTKEYIKGTTSDVLMEYGDTYEKEGYLWQTIKIRTLHREIIDFNVQVWIFESITIEYIGSYYEDGDNTKYTTRSSGGSVLNFEKEPPTISNYLIQNKNTYYGNAFYDSLLQTLKNNYSKGIECCEMQCTFSDYYYEDGELAYDATGKDKPIECFQKYDCVVPYVVRRGQVVPYSLKNDGTAKSFKIMGIKYDYVGIPKQTLYLQETTNKFEY